MRTDHTAISNRRGLPPSNRPRFPDPRTSLSHSRAFDWGSDPRWREYLTQLTFPPGRDDLVVKYQARWFKREVDPDLDVDAVTPQAPPRAPEPQTAPPPQQQRTTRPASAPARTSQASTTPASLRPLDLLLLAAHIAIVVATVAALQPVSRYLAHRAYPVMLRASLFANGVRLVRKVGRPPLSLTGIKPWMARATTTSEFFYLICPVMLGQLPTAWIGVAPGAIVAAYHAAAGLQAVAGRSAAWRRLGAARAHAWLASRQGDALRMATILEIVTWAAVALAIPRQGMKAAFSTFMYGNQLRGRFWGPESRAQHLEAWAQLGAAVGPLLGRVAVLSRVAAAGRAWFEAAGRQQQANAPHQD